MKKYIIITSMLSLLVTMTGCATGFARIPFNTKCVSDKALESDGIVEYTRTVKITPTKALIPVVVTNTDNTVSIKMIPPELIAAGGEAIAKIVVPVFKDLNDSYAELMGAAQIEITETYKHVSED